MTTVNEDIETLEGSGSTLFLEGAQVEVEVEKLRTRQLFKFLKILTVGAGPALAELQIAENTPPDELAQQLIGILIVSIPEAEDEVLDFLRSMIRPKGLIEPERTKADREKNEELYTELYSKFINPEIEDAIDLLTKVVTDEAPNMIALGKRVAALLPSAAKPTTSSTKRSKK